MTIRASPWGSYRVSDSVQLLDFSAYPEWHTEWIKGIEIQEKEKTGTSLGAGDKIQVNIEGFKFVADIKVRSFQGSDCETA